MKQVDRVDRVSADAVVRPLAAADVAAAQEMSYTALRTAGQVYGWEMPALDDAARRRGERRMLHCLQHDPDGAFVAEVDGSIVGIALATRREDFWFLSLLSVETSQQSRGVGGRLLGLSLGTFGEAGAICASNDPKALRRYRSAGFDLVPTYEATGRLDRSLLPAVGGVRDGSYDEDRGLVEWVARHQRGAGHGPDLDYFAAGGRPLYVVDDADGQGYVVCMDAGPAVLGATSVAAAERLLWAALASATAEEMDVGWLTHRQQWALDVVLAARLSLRPTGSLCLRGPVGPMWPYIPNGGLG